MKVLKIGYPWKFRYSVTQDKSKSWSSWFSTLLSIRSLRRPIKLNSVVGKGKKRGGTKPFITAYDLRCKIMFSNILNATSTEKQNFC